MRSKNEQTLCTSGFPGIGWVFPRIGRWEKGGCQERPRISEVGTLGEAAIGKSYTHGPKRLRKPSCDPSDGYSKNWVRNSVAFRFSNERTLENPPCSPQIPVCTWNLRELPETYRRHTRKNILSKMTC